MAEERHLRVARTARFWTAGGPAELAREVWFVCHGYGQLASRFIGRFEPVAEKGRLIVAPEALNRFYLDDRPGPHGPESRVGATWMTREDRLVDIRDYIDYLDSLYAHVIEGTASRRRIVALGFSQGTATVARWAAARRHGIDDVVLWSGGMPPELEARPDLFGDARLTIVAGAADRMVTVDALRRLTHELTAAGVSVTLLEHAGGHRIEVAALPMLLAGLREARAAG